MRFSHGLGLAAAVSLAAGAARAGEFDPAFISGLKEGATTMAQAVKALGRPSNQMKGRGEDRVLMWDYPAVKPRDGGPSKHLIAVMVFGGDGVLSHSRVYVKDADTAGSGPEPSPHATGGP